MKCEHWAKDVKIQTKKYKKIAFSWKSEKVFHTIRLLNVVWQTLRFALETTMCDYSKGRNLLQNLLSRWTGFQLENLLFEYWITSCWASISNLKLRIQELKSYITLQRWLNVKPWTGRLNRVIFDNNDHWRTRYNNKWLLRTTAGNY